MRRSYDIRLARDRRQQRVAGRVARKRLSHRIVSYRIDSDEIICLHKSKRAIMYSKRANDQHNARTVSLQLLVMLR